MTITIKLDAETLDILRMLIDALEDAAKAVNGETVSIAPWPEPPELIVHRDGAKVTQEAEGPVKAAEPEYPEFAEVRTKLIDFKNTKGIEAAKALLTEFAVSKASELKPEHYQPIIERIAEELK